MLGSLKGAWVFPAPPFRRLGCVMRITKQFHFDYAHRVLGHSGKCRYLHGHHGVAEISLATKGLETLNELDMVADFQLLKDTVGQWIDTYWDHNILLHSDDPLLIMLGRQPDVFMGRIPYILLKRNPTAEAMALSLFNAAERLLFSHKQERFTVRGVRVYETPTSWAEADLRD